MESLAIKRLTRQLMDDVAQQARNSPRQRKNHNFHDLSENVNRFLNVFQPGTYVRPHRHIRPPQMNGFEFFLILQGAVGIIIMDETGQILGKELVSANGSTLGLELPEGVYHTVVALAPDTVTLEVKEGPYNPSADKEFLEIFPAEGTPEADRLAETWQGLFAQTQEIPAFANQ